MQQTAKIDFKYKISGKDKFSAWLVESWDRERNETASSQDRGVNVNLNSSYVHSFGKGLSLSIDAGYQFNRKGSLISATGLKTFNSQQTVDLSAKLENLSFRIGEDKLTFSSGVNSLLTTCNSSCMNSRSVYASPFLAAGYTHAGLNMKATVRYQFNDRYLRPASGLHGYQAREHDILADVSALWQVCPHHALRFILSRNLERPTDGMLYPELLFNAASGQYTNGNPDLERAYIHSAEVGYITDCARNGHSLMFNINLGYDRADGVIESHLELMPGTSKLCTKYDNSGTNNLIKSNASFVYRYRILTVIFAGNVFRNNMLTNGKSNRYACSNFSLSPILGVNGGWTLATRMVYNSRIVRSDCELGDCFYAQMRLSKSLCNWQVSATVSDIFSHTTTDVTTTPSGVITSAYKLYGRYAGLSLSYRFGSRSVTAHQE